MTPTLHCGHFAALGVECCSSCHEDADDGYSYLMGGAFTTTEGEAFEVDVCCIVLTAIRAHGLIAQQQCIDAAAAAWRKE